MNCKFAKVNGTKALINFLTKDNRMAMIVQKMDEEAEVVELSRIDMLLNGHFKELYEKLEKEGL